MDCIACFYIYISKPEGSNSVEWQCLDGWELVRSRRECICCILICNQVVKIQSTPFCLMSLDLLDLLRDLSRNHSSHCPQIRASSLPSILKAAEPYVYHESSSIKAWYRSPLSDSSGCSPALDGENGSFVCLTIFVFSSTVGDLQPQIVVVIFNFQILRYTWIFYKPANLNNICCVSTGNYIGWWYWWREGEHPSALLCQGRVPQFIHNASLVFSLSVSMSGKWMFFICIHEWKVNVGSLN
jgi:hypothetical protein